jgi:hypothetical protein
MVTLVLTRAVTRPPAFELLVPCRTDLKGIPGRRPSPVGAAR